MKKFLKLLLGTSILLSNQENLCSDENDKIIEQTMHNLKANLENPDFKWVEEASELTQQEKEALIIKLYDKKLPPYTITSASLIFEKPYTKITLIDIRSGYININGKIFKQDYTATVYNNLLRFLPLFPKAEKTASEKIWQWISNAFLPQAQALVDLVLNIFNIGSTANAISGGAILDSAANTFHALSTPPPASTTVAATTTPSTSAQSAPSPSAASTPQTASPAAESPAPSTPAPQKSAPSGLGAMPSEKSASWYKACYDFANSLKVTSTLNQFQNANCERYVLSKVVAPQLEISNNQIKACDALLTQLDALNQKAAPSLSAMNEGNIHKAQQFQTSSFSLKDTFYEKNIAINNAKLALRDFLRKNPQTFQNYKNGAANPCAAAAPGGIPGSGTPEYIKLSNLLDKKMQDNQEAGSIPHWADIYDAQLTTAMEQNGQIAEQAQKNGLIGKDFVNKYADPSVTPPPRATQVE